MKTRTSVIVVAAVAVAVAVGAVFFVQSTATDPAQVTWP